MTDKAYAGIRAHDKPITVTYEVDLSGAYASGDLLAQPMKLEGAAFGDHYGSLTTLQSVSVVDPTGQGANLSIIFHNVDVEDCGTLNAAPTISVAKAKSCVGVVAITDWEDLGTPQVGYANQVGLLMEADGNGDLWAWLLCKGTPTYTVNELQVTFNFYRS